MSVKSVEQYTSLLNKGHFAASFKYILPYVVDKRVLDIGCCTGIYLEKFSKGSVGIDASSPNLQRLKKSGLKGIMSDLNDTIPFKTESFDVVFCSHLLEHVDAPINLLKECRRVLKPQGLIIIALPLEKSLARIVLRDHYFLDHPGHLYSFSFDCLNQLLITSGFEYQKTFMDIPGVRLIKAIWIMDFFQYLPLYLSRWFASNYWVIGKVKP